MASAIAGTVAGRQRRGNAYAVRTRCTQGDLPGHALLLVDLLQKPADVAFLVARGRGDLSYRPALGQQRRHPGLRRRQVEQHRQPDRVDARTVLRVDHEHQGRHPAAPEVRLPGVDGVYVKLQPRPKRGPLDPDRAAPRRRLAPEHRQRAFQQPLQTTVIRRQRSVQGAVPVGQALAAAQNVLGGGVRRHHAPVAVQAQDADPAVVQQTGQPPAQRLGAGQRLTNPNHVADMRQQRLDQPELIRLPAAASDRVADSPDHTQAVHPVEARNQAVLALAAAPSLVVRRRRPQLPLGVQVGNIDQLADGPLREAGRPFVVGVVHVEVLVHQVLSRLAAVEQPGEVDVHPVAGALADRQHVSRGATGMFDQGGGGGPVHVVEGGPMQQREDSIEGNV